MHNRTLRILFIGNSHTYFHDLPHIVATLAQEDGVSCQVTMLAHGGWLLEQHAAEPEVRFNLRYGGYDYVVLQEYTHPMAPAEKFRPAAATLCAWIREAGARPVLYGTWAQKSEPDKQAEMDALFRLVAEETGAIPALVSTGWWQETEKTEMYFSDGQHASPAGSRFAAKTVWKAIRKDLQK